MPPYLLLAAILISAASAQNGPGQNISQVLASQSLTKFSSLLDSSLELLQQLGRGNVTVLAPTDDALSKLFGDSLPDAGEQADAFIQYHVLQGTQPGSLLNGSAIFLPTLLYDTNYTNVTGGQRVEAANGVLFSALKAKSSIVKADIFFNVGGLMHIIDAVLSPPVDISNTITGADLNDLVALATEAGLVGPQALASGDFFDVSPDLTFFAPNDPEFGANFTGFSDLTHEAAVDLVAYHQVSGTVIYSDVMTDGATFKTRTGENITITIVNGSTYVNAAKITIPDLLTANGVMQVIDSPLNPNDTSARPSIASATHAKPAATTAATNQSSPSPSPSASSGLSTGAKAGIGVGIAIGVLLALALGFVFIRRKQNSGSSRRAEPHGHAINYPLMSRSPPAELDPKSHPLSELESRDRRLELE